VVGGRAGEVGVSGTGFRMIARFEVPPEEAAAFEAAWDVMGAAARAHPSNVEQWLSRCRDENAYVVISDWADPAGFTDFRASEAHRAAGVELRRRFTAVSVSTVDVVRHLVPGHAPAPR
jgi:heme-degrading monooxygenase HmoA